MTTFFTTTDVRETGFMLCGIYKMCGTNMITWYMLKALLDRMPTYEHKDVIRAEERPLGQLLTTTHIGFDERHIFIRENILKQDNSSTVSQLHDKIEDERLL